MLLDLRELFEITPNVVMSEVLSYSVRLTAGSSFIEDKELLSLNEPVVVGIIGLKEAHDTLIVKLGLLSGAPLDEEGTGLFGHLSIRIRVEVKPIVEDLSYLIS